MRLIVVSDTHRRFAPFEKVLQKHPEADAFIHLGDGREEVAAMRSLYPERRFFSVCGNCDYGSRDDTAGLIELEGVRVFYTHGHLYQVKQGLGALLREAKRVEASVALYGHTHTAYSAFIDGIHVLNPGSLGTPRNGKASYGVVDITPQGIDCHVASLWG